MRDLLRGVDLAIGTPGRLNDLLEGGGITLSEVRYLVLDEADRMLDMGFEPQIRSIIEALPQQRQNLFFTATWPKSVEQLAASYLRNPCHIKIGDEGQLNANKNITQNIHIVKNLEKMVGVLF